jgi:FKBP-type peptidyl-prolyl cis-trans isomerase
MRALFLFAMAAGMVLAAGSVTPADDKKSDDKEKKLMRPDLNAKEWKKLDGGLEIWDVKEGKGEAVKAGGRVKVHYTGWLTDDKATIFDSSVERNEPIEFGLDGVIKGWQQGIPGMKPGGVRRLKIPPDLAYGKRGAGRAVPPDATLIFEVELLEVK